MTSSQITASLTRSLSVSLLLVACGIPTSQSSPESEAISSAADATASLSTYGYEWTAQYEFVDPNAAQLSVAGSGVVDTGTESVDARIDYDEGLRNDFARLFPKRSDDPIYSLTRIVGDEVYISGLNAALMPGASEVEPDVWYRVTDRRTDVGDAFVRSQVRPVDVIPEMVAPLVAAGLDRLVVDRDVILDLGTRFPGSLVDFGLRIGGGDFTVEIERRNGLVSRATIIGDDPEADVARFAFAIEFSPLESVSITAPPGAVTLP